MGNNTENSKNIIIGIGEVGTNTINRMRKMRVSKYLLLWLSLFFFNICFASCRNQKAEKVEQGDRMEVGEGKNDSLLEILRGHEYVYGGEKMSIDSTFSIMDTMAFPFDENLIVVNGNKDELGPTFSFIIDTETKKSILLPSNRGCFGFTSEEGLPICLSFRHHTNGEPGRYSVVSVYDEKGNLVKEMSFEDYKKDEEL